MPMSSCHDNRITARVHLAQHPFKKPTPDVRDSKKHWPYKLQDSTKTDTCFYPTEQKIFRAADQQYLL